MSKKLWLILFLGVLILPINSALALQSIDLLERRINLNNPEINSDDINIHSINVSVKEGAVSKILGKNNAGFYSYNFGELTEPLTKTFIIRNTGSANLNLESFGFKDGSYNNQFSLSGNSNCLGIIKVNGSCEIAIKFTPDINQYGYLVRATVKLGEPNYNHYFDLIATSIQIPKIEAGIYIPMSNNYIGIKPLSFSPLQIVNGSPFLDFGETDEITIKEIILKNIGTGNLISEGNGFEENTNSQFSFAEPPKCLGTFAPGKTCSIKIKFTPTVDQYFIEAHGEVYITTNDIRLGGPEHKYKISLKAHSTLAPKITINIQDPKQLNILPKLIALEETSRGFVKYDLKELNDETNKTLILKNTGKADLTIEAVGFETGADRQFSFPKNPECLGVIKSGETCKVFIKFSPDESKAGYLAIAKLFFESNDPRTSVNSNHRYIVEIVATYLQKVKADNSGLMNQIIKPENQNNQNIPENNSQIESSNNEQNFSDENTSDSSLLPVNEEQVCQGECVIRNDGSINNKDEVSRQLVKENDEAKKAAETFIVKLFNFLSRMLDKIASIFHF